MKDFTQKINTNKAREMFEFISGHFTYYTMSSWNITKSIANNVKIYNLGLDKEVENKAYELLFNEDELIREQAYENLNWVIEDWEEKNPNYKAYLNGRSGGYLVLYNNNNYHNVLANTGINFEQTYEEWKKELRYNDEKISDHIGTLKKVTELICSFDMLCNDMVAQLVEMCNDSEIVEEEEVITVVKKRLVLND